MFVIGLGSDNNYYTLDIVRDRLNLTERATTLFNLHRRWNPLAVGYERYGVQSDIQHINYVMDIQGYHFTITEVGGSTPKLDRIKRLIPIFEQGRMWLPQTIIRPNYEGRVENLVDVFIKSEYLTFPVCVHEDMFDCMARIVDPGFPTIFPVRGRHIKPTQKRAMR
jgi:phage terminase large subunit-like protein